MSKISPVKPKELVRFLVSIGFCEVRTKGSHMIMKDKDGNMTVVPMHAGKDIPVGTLIAILRDIGIEKEDFVRMFKKK